MNKSSDSSVNSVKISQNVISRIAENAISSVEGIKGLVSSKKGIEALFAGKSGQPLNIRMNGGSAEISLNIIVSDSCKVKSAAENIQKRVKEDVQNMTGIVVTKVNVFVSDIIFETE